MYHSMKHNIICTRNRMITHTPDNEVVLDDLDFNDCKEDVEIGNDPFLFSFSLPPLGGGTVPTNCCWSRLCWSKMLDSRDI